MPTPSARDQLIAAGWKPPVELPPMTDEEYEQWRPALQAYCLMSASFLVPSTPLDSVDKAKIDVLREVTLLAPKANEPGR